MRDLSTAEIKAKLRQETAPPLKVLLYASGISSPLAVSRRICVTISSKAYPPLSLDLPEKEKIQIASTRARRENSPEAVRCYYRAFSQPHQFV